MASTTAEPPPFGDADYVLALQWEGTWLRSGAARTHSLGRRGARKARFTATRRPTGARLTTRRTPTGTRPSSAGWRRNECTLATTETKKTQRKPPPRGTCGSSTVAADRETWGCVTFFECLGRSCPVPCGIGVGIAVLEGKRHRLIVMH